MRKDIVSHISAQEGNEIMALAYDLDNQALEDMPEFISDRLSIEGNLIDEYAFTNRWDYSDGKFKAIRITPRIKARKYMILEEEALNEWSSGYKVTETDNEQLYLDFESRYERYLDQMEKLDLEQELEQESIKEA